MRQYGWEHPEADNKLRLTFQGIIDALREDSSRVAWTLRPYYFVHRGQVIWEPGSPLRMKYARTMDVPSCDGAGVATGVPVGAGALGVGLGAGSVGSGVLSGGCDPSDG